MKKIITLFFLVFAVASLQAQTVYFKGILQGSQQVPANASTAAGGVVIVTYDTVSNILMLNGNFKGLTTPVMASHIHSPAAPGVSAGDTVSSFFFRRYHGHYLRHRYPHTSRRDRSDERHDVRKRARCYLPGWGNKSPAFDGYVWTGLLF